MHKKIKVNSVNKTNSRGTEKNILYQEKRWRKLDMRRGKCLQEKRIKGKLCIGTSNLGLHQCQGMHE